VYATTCSILLEGSSNGNFTKQRQNGFKIVHDIFQEENLISNDILFTHHLRLVIFPYNLILYIHKKSQTPATYFELGKPVIEVTPNNTLSRPKQRHSLRYFNIHTWIDAARKQFFCYKTN